MSAGLGNGRYETSPLRIFNVTKGSTGRLVSHSFDRKADIEFGKYGFPNQIQVRNNSTNKLLLSVNDSYTFQVPPLLFETYNFEEEEIKRITIDNLEDFETDDLIQVVVAKEITQNMVNRLIYDRLRRG